MAVMDCSNHKFGSHLSSRSSGHSHFISWVVTLWVRERDLLSVPTQMPIPALKLQPFSPKAHAHQPRPSSSPPHSQPQGSLSHHLLRGLLFSFPWFQVQGDPCRCKPETLTPGLFPPPLPPLLPEEELAPCSYKGKQESIWCFQGTWKGPNGHGED